MENNADCGMYYETTVLTPIAFCQWLKRKCEAKGVTFIRRDMASLGEATRLAPADVVVNASGVGSRFLHDVRDMTCHSVRGQTLVVKCDADKIWAHHGASYTYVIPRGDGTAILGGIKEVDAVEPHVNEDIQRDVGHLSSLLSSPHSAYSYLHTFMRL
jgi:glycine/D-amino acid oxidase-like deaminating enzyme